jgi:hypothetical protein
VLGFQPDSIGRGRLEGVELHDCGLAPLHLDAGIDRDDFAAAVAARPLAVRPGCHSKRTSCVSEPSSQAAAASARSSHGHMPALDSSSSLPSLHLPRQLTSTRLTPQEPDRPVAAKAHTRASVARLGPECASGPI